MSYTFLPHMKRTDTLYIFKHIYIYINSNTTPKTGKKNSRIPFLNIHVNFTKPRLRVLQHFRIIRTQLLVFLRIACATAILAHLYHATSGDILGAIAKGLPADRKIA